MMPKTGLIGVATLSLAIASPGVAQEKPGTIAEVVVTRAKAGAVKAYEEGRKRHMAWHKKQNDPWSWHTWHADVDLNLTPHTESATVGYYELLPELSRPPAGQAHTKMSEVVHFLLKPDKAAEFRHALQRAHEAIGKTNWPVTYLWYELSNGGEGPHFVLVLPHNSWAEMAQPEMSFPAMLTKAFGPYETGVILEGFDQSSRSQWSEILVYRPELSHVASQ